MEESFKKINNETYAFDPRGKGAWRLLGKNGKFGKTAKAEYQKRWGNPNDQGVFDSETAKKTSTPKSNTERLKNSIGKYSGLRTFSSLLKDQKENLGSATMKYVKQQFRPEVMMGNFFGDYIGQMTGQALGVSKERMENLKKGYDYKEKNTEKKLKPSSDFYKQNKADNKFSNTTLEKVNTELQKSNLFLKNIDDYFSSKKKTEDVANNFAEQVERNDERKHKEVTTLLTEISDSLKKLKSGKKSSENSLFGEGAEGGSRRADGGLNLEFSDLDRRRGGRGQRTPPSAPRQPRTPGRLGRFFKGLGVAAGLGAVGVAGTAMASTRATETRTTADFDNRALLESEENRKKAVAEAEDARNKAALEAENAKKTIEKANAENAKAIQNIENKSKQTVADAEQRSKEAIEKAQIEKNKAIADAEQKTKAAIEKVEAEKAEIDKKAKEAVEKANADKNMAVQEKEKAIAEANAEKEKAIAEANDAKEKAIAEANAEKEKTIAEKEKAIKDVEAEKQKAIAEANDAKEKAIVEANEAKQKAITEANEKVSNLEKAKAEADAKLSEFEKTAVKTTPEAGKVTPPPAATGVTPSPTAAAITTPPAATGVTPTTTTTPSPTAAAITTPPAAIGVTPTTTTTPSPTAVPETPTSGSKVGKAANKIVDGLRHLGPIGDLIGIGLAISAIQTARNNATAEVMSGQISEDDAEKQFKKETVSILSGEVGGFAGGVLGAIAGQMMIPIPFLGSLIGGITGGVAGGIAGETMGEKLYDFLSKGGEIPSLEEIREKYEKQKLTEYKSQRNLPGFDEYGVKTVDPNLPERKKKEDQQRYEKEKEEAKKLIIDEENLVKSAAAFKEIRQRAKEFARTSALPDTTIDIDDMSRDFTKFPVTGKAETEPTAPSPTPTPRTTPTSPKSTAATRTSRTSVERMSVDDGMMSALITPASFTPTAPTPTTISTTNMAERASTNIPRAENQQLGFMAKQYESGKAGSAAIGYDKTGGSSYGAYQIATKTGTMQRFMSHLKETNPEAYERLSAAGDPNVPGGGRFGQEWKKLAAEGKLQQSEHEFIKKTHYDVGMKQVKNEELQNMIGESKALQEVMWSTSVQHGGGGASSIFNKVYKPGMSQEELIKAVYAERGTKFGSSTEDVRASVLNRFQKEQEQALALAAQPKESMIPNIPDSIETAIPEQQNLTNTASDLIPTERTTGAAIESRAQELSMNKEAAATTPPVIAPNTTNITNVNNSGGGGETRHVAGVRNDDPAFIRMQMTSSLYQVS